MKNRYQESIGDGESAEGSIALKVKASEAPGKIIRHSHSTSGYELGVGGLWLSSSLRFTIH